MAENQSDYKVCEQCGNPYRVPPSRFSESKYCSYECKGKAKTKQVEAKPCEQCGKLYQTRPGQSPSRFLDSQYCSVACRGAAKRRVPPLKPCEQCGKLYGPGTRKLHQFLKSKYCSQECFGASCQNGLAQALTLIEQRIHHDPLTGCHVWPGSRTERDGYGQITIRGERCLVHRVIWEHRNGPVPEGLQIDHICRNCTCCNIEHLRLLRPEQNILASDNMAARYARRENCDKCGGPFSTFPNGIRYCKPCRHAKMMESQRRRRAETKAQLSQKE